MGSFSSSGKDSYSADLVLACDGIKSTIRDGEFDVSGANFHKLYCLEGVVDESNFPQFSGNDQVNIYHGPGGHVVHYPIGNENKINFVAIETGENWEEESWKRKVTKWICFMHLTIGI